MFLLLVQVFSPYPSALSVEGVKCGGLDSVGGPGSAPPPPSAQPQPPPQEPPPPTLKRPVLSTRDYESILQEEEQPSHLLYDYSSLEAWYVLSSLVSLNITNKYTIPILDDSY